jgi:hypothetical protein
MRSLIAFACFFALGHIGPQSTGVAQALKGDLTAPVPSSELVFSEPKLDSPVQLPAYTMSGGPICGPEGRAFLQIMTPPPRFEHKFIYSVSSDGKATGYPLDRISGLSNPSIVAFDPGLSMPVFLLRAADAGQRGTSGFYLALFNLAGEVRNYVKLDLGIKPSNVAQLSDNSFLVLGVDSATDKSKFIVVDSSGRLLRDLDAETIMPSDAKLKSILGSLSGAPEPQNLPQWMKLSATLGMMELAHSDQGLLIFLPGAETRVVVLPRSGEIHAVALGLPQDQVADSLIADRGKWFVKTYQRGNDSDSGFYEVDPETGSVLRRIKTPGVPVTSIACPVDNGFYGFKWVDGKPYLMFGSLK